MKEPRPGHYLDSCGTRYEATKSKAGWQLNRLQSATGHTYPPKPFPADGFPKSVEWGYFVATTEQ